MSNSQRESKHNSRKAGSLTKDILKYLLISGVVILAMSSPMAASSIIRQIKKEKQYTRRQAQNSLYYLKRKNYISITPCREGQNISLTQDGREYAGRCFILKDIKFQRTRWDRKWRIIIFDIQSGQKLFRDSIRMMLQRIGCYQLQKSVWVYPHDCRKEISFVRNTLNLTEKELRVITADDIENDRPLRKVFKL